MFPQRPLFLKKTCSLLVSSPERKDGSVFGEGCATISSSWTSIWKGKSSGVMMAGPDEKYESGVGGRRGERE